MGRPRKGASRVWPRTVQLGALLIFGADLSTLGIGLKQGVVLCLIAAFLAAGRP